MRAQDAPGRQAERHEIVRAVEAVVKPVEDAGVRGRIESQHEAMGRLSHPCQRPLDPWPEEIDAAVGQARRQERDDLTVGGGRDSGADSESRPDRCAAPSRPRGRVARAVPSAGTWGHPVTSRGRF